MWSYSQKVARFSHNGVELQSECYSGAAECKNDPASQFIHNKGSIPQGQYHIEKPRDTHEHGPFVIPLTPHTENIMHGRGGFLIHGDSITQPGTASQGCIITGRTVRMAIWESNDHELTVTE